MKRLFLLPAMCIIVMLSANKTTAQAVASGTTGDCTWTLTGASGNYTLTISGLGAMGDYKYGEAPWYSYRSGIKTLNIKRGVTTIGYAAFDNCSGLTSVTIPKSITAIGEEFFFFCYGLTDINVGAGNPNYSSINGVLFNKLRDTLIQYPEGKTGSYTVPRSVTTIGNSAFAYCDGLTSVTIPNSVTSIGDRAFSFCCGLTSITIPNSVMSIGDRAFSSCSRLTSVTIGNSVTTVGDQAFFSCSSLTSVTIPTSVTAIGNSAFAYCSGLTSVTIPKSVTAIGNGAFAFCSSLTSVIIKATTPPHMEEDVFYGVSKETPLYVPCGALADYKKSDWGSRYFNNIIEDCGGGTGKEVVE